MVETPKEILDRVREKMLRVVAYPEEARDRMIEALALRDRLETTEGWSCDHDFVDANARSLVPHVDDVPALLLTTKPEPEQ